MAERFTVIFDLDETLSHTTENKEGADAYIPVTTPDKKQIKVDPPHSALHLPSALLARDAQEAEPTC